MQPIYPRRAAIDLRFEFRHNPNDIVCLLLKSGLFLNVEASNPNASIDFIILDLIHRNSQGLQGI